MIKKIIDKVFSNVRFFNSFRDFIHHDFIKEKAIIKRELNISKRTLDFGCGSGQYSVLFKKGCYFGADGDKKCIEFARKEYTKQTFVLTENNRKLQFKDGFFDQILAMDFFHHISPIDIDFILNEMKRLLSKNGKLFIIDHPPKQKKMLARLLMAFDRGQYAKDPEELLGYLLVHFKLVKKFPMKTGPYVDYVLILSKN